MIRLAIVGVGWAGSRHVEAIRELGEKVEVVCLVDNDAGFLSGKASEFGIEKTYTNLSDALNDPDVDAVDICSPHHLHCEQAIAAAEAGKHVLVEKPMATTVEEATRMMVAADQNGVKLYVAESAVYTPMSQMLREIVQAGKYVGEVVSASFVGGFRAPNFTYPGRRELFTLPNVGGTGTWTLHGIHSMAQLRYILGEVKTVYMQEFHVQSFERPSEGEPFNIEYPKATLSEHALELAAFADYVKDEKDGPTDAVSEQRSTAIIQAGYESAEHGRPVNLQERFGDL